MLYGEKIFVLFSFGNRVDPVFRVCTSQTTIASSFAHKLNLQIFCIPANNDKKEKHDYRLVPSHRPRSVPRCDRRRDRRSCGGENERDDLSNGHLDKFYAICFTLCLQRNQRNQPLLSCISFCTVLLTNIYVPRSQSTLLARVLELMNCKCHRTTEYDTTSHKKRKSDAPRCLL